jgi:hypothetical protein
MYAYFIGILSSDPLKEVLKEIIMETKLNWG